MKRNGIVIWVILATTVLLAAMGCWFCWHCPSRIYPPEVHALFWRQLAWNGIGIAVFAGAWAAGWKRLLNAAPWLMAAWLAAFVAARLSYPSRGMHRWLSIGTLRLNVATCFMPVFALFVAWLHDKKWLRPWMEWTAIAVAVLGGVWYVAGNSWRMEQLSSFFSSYFGRSYMSRQHLAAFGLSNWFGDADRSLGFLPCPESDGMMSACALFFGKWFPLAVVALFAMLGVAFASIWKAAPDAAKRRFVSLYALWLVIPALYCFLHSLALLPVAGFSPALASYGDMTVVSAWFGIGAISAMVESFGFGSGVGAGNRVIWRWVGAWGACVLLAAGAIEFASKSGLEFTEPRPSDMEFGEFGLKAKRGRILAADGSSLAYTVRAWNFRVDPHVPEAKVGDPYRFVKEIAEGLGLDEEKVRTVYQNKKSRYIFLSEVDDKSPASEWYVQHRSQMTLAGIICKPVQKRVYPLGAAAATVVGFTIDSYFGPPTGAGGIEWAYDKSLSGIDGVYDKWLPQKERRKNATPMPGADVQTTLVPELQKAVADILSSACATNGSESAFALVMRCPSGEIAAMASWPTFDPSKRRDNDWWRDELTVNRAAQTVFEPGGLVKPLTYAIALDEGVLAEDAKLDQGDGTWEYNGVTLEDEATNTLSIAEAIERRVNIAAGKTACLVGPEKFHSALRRFGFGGNTRTAGIPGEESGILALKPDRWDKITAMRVGMGYGFAATGLQIARSYATLANHGTLVRPVLIAGGASSSATNGATQVVSPAAADTIVRMLKTPMPSTVQMIERDKESGRVFYSPTNYIASCAGFVSLNKPDEYVVVVSFSKPRSAHTGDEVAKPVFQLIADSWVKSRRRLLQD